MAGKLDQKSIYQVHLFIKHFWIDGMPEKRLDQTFCRTQIETFLQAGDAFYPLFRFDTSFIALRQSVGIGHVTVSAFQYCIEKIAASSPDSVVKSKRKLTIDDILSSYQKKRDYPQLKQSNLTKGVYLTYQDFLNNKTCYPELKYEQTLYADDLYITENGKESMLNEFWGFCDGKKQFMRLGHNFYQLTRQNQTFELHGPSSIDLLRKRETGAVISNGAGPGAELVSFGIFGWDAGDRLIFKPMQLNIETGKPYGF